MYNNFCKAKIHTIHRRTLMTKYFVFLLSLLLPLSVQAKITDEELNEVLTEHPEIVINAIQKYQDQQKEAKDEAIKNNFKQINKNHDNIFVGNENADIVLVEFFDFSCGYCSRLAPHIQKVIKNNPNIKVIFNPVTFVGPRSLYAAKASIAANNQGKFLEFYTEIFSRNRKISETDIDNVAKSIGLNMERYFTDLKSEKTTKIISNISESAQKSDVSGVPTLLLNGSVIQAYTDSEIEAAIRNAKQ